MELVKEEEDGGKGIFTFTSNHIITVTSNPRGYTLHLVEHIVECSLSANDFSFLKITLLPISTTLTILSSSLRNTDRIRSAGCVTTVGRKVDSSSSSVGRDPRL